MAKGRGGFGGGMPGNMNQIMKQAQRMQAQMEEQQAQIQTMEFEASAGGGAVSVTVNGNKEVTKVVIAPEDVEMLQDLIMAACNEALKKCDQETRDRMSQITGGLGGGLF